MTSVEETHDGPMNNEIIYSLGSLGDLEMCVSNGGVVIRCLSKPHKQVELTPNTWARLRVLLPDILEVLNKKTSAVAYEEHIGNGYYVSVYDGVVYIRKFYLPDGLEYGNQKPTKHGVSLRLEEWGEFLTLIPYIELTFPSLKDAIPCYEQSDHLGQLGYFACTSCNPFGNPCDRIYD